MTTAVANSEVLHKYSVESANKTLTIKNSETSGNVVSVVKSMCESAGSNYDFATAAFKTAELTGNAKLVNLMAPYRNTTALFRVPTTLITVSRDLAKLCCDKSERTFRQFTHLVHDFFDFAAMTSFTAMFFTNVKSYLHAGLVFNFFADDSDLVNFTTDCCEARKLRAQLIDLKDSEKPHLKAVYDAVDTKMVYAGMKALKCAAGAFAGLFTVYTIMTGLVLVSPTIPLVASLGATLLNITAAGYSKYQPAMLDHVEVVKVKLA